MSVEPKQPDPEKAHCECSDSTGQCFDRLISKRPDLTERIYRQLLVTLHRRGIVSIDDISREARRAAGRSSTPRGDNPNAPAGERLDSVDREAIRRRIRHYTIKHLSVAEIEDQVNLVLKREEAQSLGDVARLPGVSFRTLT